MNDVEVTIAVAREGAKVVRRRFGTTLDRVAKPGNDFATSADLEAEAAMLAVLRRERPNDVVFGEETGRSGLGTNGRMWLVDPLCGTLNYAAGTRVGSVNVALKVGSQSVAAAVSDPFNHETFWTDGIKAFVRINDQDRRLTPDSSTKLVDLNFDPPFPTAPAFRAVVLAADAKFAELFKPRVFSTSIALTWVASGQRAAYVTDGDVRDSVHFAAGMAICEAAGCTVTDLRGARSWTGATGLVVAADFETHTALLRLVSKYLDERLERRP